MASRWMKRGLFAAGLAAMACAQAQADEAAARYNPEALQAGQRYDRFIVVYRDGSRERTDAAAAAQQIDAAAARAGLAAGARAKAMPASARHLRKLAIGADLLRTGRRLDRDEAEHLLRQLAADPAVAYAAPDVRRQPVRDRAAGETAYVPNDPYYVDDQWHLRAPDGSAEPEPATGGTVPNRGGANVAKAWNLADGSGITVAVLDTGITRHPDLDTSLADAGYDFITDAFVSGRAADGRVPGGWDTGDWTTDPKYYVSTDPAKGCVDPGDPDNLPSDSSWHGTHVAGTVAELTDNGRGEAGVAPRARLLPVRVLGHCGGYDSDISDAIVWAAGGHVDGVPDNRHPAQVINLSLGGGGKCKAADPTAQAIAKARALGAVVVVAAGNAGDNAAQYTPASCPGALTVAATGITGRRAFYSNYGKRVDLAAPGGGIYANDADAGDIAYTGFVWQALNGGSHEPTADYRYGGFAGTSQATPHVSGSIALLQSARLATGQALLAPAEAEAIVKETAHAPAVPPKAAQPIGAGILDAYAAVLAAVNADVRSLRNGVPAFGVGAEAGRSRLFKLEVPAGSLAVALLTYGGSGDVTLYAKRDGVPTREDYDQVSAHRGNAESVVLLRPQAGTYYLRIEGGDRGFGKLFVQGLAIGGELHASR